MYLGRNSKRKRERERERNKGGRERQSKRIFYWERERERGGGYPEKEIKKQAGERERDCKMMITSRLKRKGLRRENEKRTERDWGRGRREKQWERERREGWGNIIGGKNNTKSN